MRKKRIVFFLEILCIISLLITMLSIQRTYARYFEMVDTTYDTHIKRWLIKVNSHYHLFSVTKGTQLFFIVLPVNNKNRNKTGAKPI